MSQTREYTSQFPNPIHSMSVGYVSPSAEATQVEWNAGDFRLCADPALQAGGLLAWLCTIAGSAGTQVPIYLQGTKGANITAASTLTLPLAVGPTVYFQVLGGTTVNFLATTGLPSGQPFWLYLVNGLTLNHNAASPPGGTVPFFLTGGANKTLAAGTALQFRYDATLGAAVEFGNGGAIAANLAAGAGIRLSGTSIVTVTNRLFEGDSNAGAGQTIYGGLNAGEPLNVFGSFAAANGPIHLTGGAGGTTVWQTAATSGVPSPALLVHSGNHTGITAGATFIASHVNLASDLYQWAGGSSPIFVGLKVSPPSALSATSTTTMPFAATFEVDGPPVAGSNMTIAAPLSLYVSTGWSAFAEFLQIGPVTTPPSNRTIQALVVNRNNTTVASAASMPFDYVFVNPATLNVTGNTHVTSAVSVVNIFPAVFNGAGVNTPTIDRAIMLNIASPPIPVAGVTITERLSLRVNGNTYLTGDNSGGLVTGGGQPGGVHIDQSGGTGILPIPVFTILGPSHTNIPAGSGVVSIDIVAGTLLTWTGGGNPSYNAFNINAPQLAATSATTFPFASTLAIGGAPTPGTNATITASYALFIGSAGGGAIRTDGFGSTGLLKNNNGAGWTIASPVTDYVSDSWHCSTALSAAGLTGALNFYWSNHLGNTVVAGNKWEWSPTCDVTRVKITVNVLAISGTVDVYVTKNGVPTLLGTMTGINAIGVYAFSGAFAATGGSDILGVAFNVPSGGAAITATVHLSGYKT